MAGTGGNGQARTLTVDELVDLLERTRPNDDEALARRGIRAWLLAPDIATYEALMRGEHVPLALLNPEAVRRYGLRR